MRIKKNRIPGASYQNHYVARTNYHLIWCTKYRNTIFDKQNLADDMKEILLETSKLNRIDIEKMEIMPDHVHLLVSFRPSKSGSSVIKALKGRSAFLFFQNHPEIKQSKMWGGHLWSPSYYFGTVGDMSKETVTKYINDQRYNAIKQKKPYPSMD